MPELEDFSQEKRTIEKQGQQVTVLEYIERKGTDGSIPSHCEDYCYFYRDERHLADICKTIKYVHKTTFQYWFYTNKAGR